MSTPELRKKQRENLAEARLNGSLYYQSTYPCINGHVTKRLVSTQQCTTCMKIRMQKKREDAGGRSKKKSNFYRELAIKNGLKHYETGQPCARGHTTKRLVSTYQCVQCLAEREKKKTEAKPLTELQLRKAAARKRTRQGKVKNRAYYREVLKNNDDYVLAHKFYSDIYKLLASNRIKTVLQNRLGYSKQDLINRIESLFKDGMSWENKGEWHIDHIKPISAFFSEDIRCQLTICALSNLQPLWAKENAQKGSKHTE